MKLRVSKLIKTDTSTLVVFDPAMLESRVDDTCDWWTGKGGLAREEAAQHLAYADPKSDGVFRVSVALGEQAGEADKESKLRVDSGVLLYGAGECMPGDGPAIEEYLGRLDIEPGVYAVRVKNLGPVKDAMEEYLFSLTKL